MNKRNIAIVLVIVIILNFLSPIILSAKAAVNIDYYNMEKDAEDFEGEINTSSIILSWIGEICYTVCFGIENMGAKIVKAFTGKEFFPWADKIIFNTIPILDINFINPAPGSLMKDTSGKETTVGVMIRNIYFTSMAIAIGFLSIIIAISGIRLAFASIAADKAKLKEAVVGWLTCLILIFGLHFILSFTFYLNEKLVEAASTIANDALSEASDEVAKNMKLQSDKDNEKIVEAFLNRCEKEALIDSIPIVGQVVSWVKDLLGAIGKALKKAWSFITGNKDDTDTIDVGTLKGMYPEKEDFLKFFREESDPKLKKQKYDVAAMMLKNKYYRSEYLKWISGNDQNDVTNAGLGGLGRNILIACNDCLGIVDTGYKALRSLYTSVALITYKGENGKPFKSVAEACLDNGKFDVNDDAIQDLKNQKAKAEFNNDKNKGYLYTIVTSTEEFNKLIDETDDNISKAYDDLNKEGADKNKIKNEIFGYNLIKLYATAYYEYIYEGDDKSVTKASDIISSLGEFFRESTWYVDTANGDWAPTTINVVSAICYGIFIIQSLMFLFAYLKRFFYVIILSLMGPIVVIFDYLSKAV